MIDISGYIFERLKVISRYPNDKFRKAMWLCFCDCGNEIVVAGSSLRSGHTKSCGCLSKDAVKGRFTKHRQTIDNKVSKVYQAWRDMLRRCYYKTHKCYNDYGGRHISVCDRWLQFDNFLDDMGNPPTKKHSLDRIDNDNNYNKNNCRWATPKQQMRNRRNNLNIEYLGKTKCLGEWSEKLGINYNTLRKRIYILGWSINKAFETLPKT